MPDPSDPRRLPGWVLPAAAGLASVVLGLGLAELTAAFVAPQASVQLSLYTFSTRPDTPFNPPAAR